MTMLKYISAFLVVLALCSFAIAQEIPSATSDQKVRLQAISSDAAAIPKGSPVIIDFADTATNSALMVEMVSGTSSVLIVGIAEDTIAVGATGNIIVAGITDVLFDAAGSTAGATFGTGNTTKGSATSGQTGGGIVLATRSGAGLAKCLVKGIGMK